VPIATIEYVVDTAVAGLPAAGKLERGDRIVATNGSPITRSLSSITNELRGAPVQLTYRRGETTREVALTPVGHDGNWILGLRLLLDTGRSYESGLVLQRAVVAPIEQVTPSRSEPSKRVVEPSGATGVEIYVRPPPTLGERVLARALWFASLLLLLVIALDLVRVVRAMRYSVSTTST
jgi:hypothetical protein